MFGSHTTYWFTHLYPEAIDRLLLIFCVNSYLVHYLHPIRFLIVFLKVIFHFQPYRYWDAKLHTLGWSSLLHRERNYYLIFGMRCDTVSIYTFVHTALLFFAARKHYSVHLLSAVTFRFSLQHYLLLYYFYETISGWVGFFPPVYFPSSVINCSFR